MTARDDKQVEEILLSDCLISNDLASNYSLIDYFNKIDLYLTQFMQYWKYNFFCFE